MAENDNDSRFDSLLDGMLSNYSAVEPRPGFEIRMRARLQAHLAQRRRDSWIFGLAGSAAIILLVFWLAQPRTATREVAPNTARQVGPQTNPAPALAKLPPRKNVSPAPTASAATNTAHARYKALLQVASMVHSGQDVSFAQEKLYTQPASPSDHVPETGQQSVAPDISIQDLGVKSIEVKELTPEKLEKNDEKGDL